MDVIAAAKAELWRRGELSFLLHAGQDVLNQTFNSSKGMVVVFNCSRQWGKTYFAAYKACEIAIRKPKAKIRYATAFETDLVEFCIPAFETVLESCPEKLRPKYNQQKKKYQFPNGSEIKLVGLDRKPNGLRGNTIDFIILDEAGFISRLDYLHSSVIVPLTTHRPDAKILVISTPPESPDHPFWDFVDRAKLEHAYAEFTIDENPLLTRKDIERLEQEMGGRHSTAFQREYLCKRIIEASRAIIPEWSDEHIQEPVTDEYYQFYQKYEAIDLGGKRDLYANLYAHYDFKRATLYIHDETVLNPQDVTTEALATAIKAKELELWKLSAEPPVVHHRISDNNNPLLNQDLAVKHQLTFRPTNKATIHEMVNLVRIWIQQGRVKISPKCQQLIGCLRSGIWDKNRAEFSRSKVYGHFDCLAALVYLIRNVDESYNPIPPSYGFDPANMIWTGKVNAPTSAGRAFEKVYGRRS